ncbi:MAG TPA: tRNA-binding protein [Cyclobacteriaceae bacterium]|nr:tRNA-binding protein [Cyclobacteriaceae bacterium]
MKTVVNEFLSWDHFLGVEMRVGTIIEADIFKEAKKPAIKLLVDFGKWGVKKSSAQITALYDPAEIVGQQVIAVINFKPKQIANFMSECLILGAVDNDGKVVLIKPERVVTDGLRIG